MDNVYLTGFMGAGKTTTGRALSRETGRAFLDLDQLVEATAGRSIPEIFSIHGERFFRNLETQAVQRVSSLRNTIVALGGGTLEDPRNLNLLKRTGTLVLLEVGVEEALRRAKGCGRPLLETPDALQRAIDLLETRKPRYRRAEFALPSDKAPDVLAREIVANLNVQCIRSSGDHFSVPVDTQNNHYQVFIGPGLLHRAGEHLLDLGANGRVVLASEPLAYSLHAEPLIQDLEQAGFEVVSHLLPGTEEAKTLGEAERFYDFLLSNGADRETFVLALGGGVVGDTSGFVASTYMRGIPIVQCPTTLLSQVDSAVGGKVAVNHTGGKNLIGNFYQPRMALADTNALSTLPDLTLAQGLAETVKGALLSGVDFLCYLEDNVDDILSREPDSLQTIVHRMVSLKAHVVSQDETDRGVRMTLNLGHTLAHALEAVTDYRVSHGEAVAIGLVWASTLGEALGVTEPGLANRVARLLKTMGLPTRTPGVDVDALISRMKADKKAVKGGIRVVLPISPGKVVIRDEVPVDALKQATGALNKRGYTT